MGMNNTKDIIENFHEMWNEERATGDFPTGHKPFIIKIGTVSEIQILLKMLGYVPYIILPLNFVYFILVLSCSLIEA
jgi:hypothetical protein